MKTIVRREKAGATDHVALATTDIEAAFAEAKECRDALAAFQYPVTAALGKTVFAFFMVEGPNKERERIEFLARNYSIALKRRSERAV